MIDQHSRRRRWFVATSFAFFYVAVSFKTTVPTATPSQERCMRSIETALGRIEGAIQANGPPLSGDMVFLKYMPGDLGDYRALVTVVTKSNTRREPSCRSFAMRNKSADNEELEHKMQDISMLSITTREGEEGKEDLYHSLITFYRRVVLGGHILVNK